MKQKLSITIDEKTVFDILQAIESGKFRNKSHVVEYAVKKLLDNECIGEANFNGRQNLPSTKICERSEQIEEFKK